MKTYTTVLAIALLSSVTAEPDKTINFGGKIKDFTFKNNQNMTLYLDESSKCDLKYNTLPWSVDCVLGVEVEADGILNQNLKFTATVGGQINSEDVDDSTTQQSMTFYYSATTPGFKFGSAWEALGVPSVEPKGFPADGNFEIHLPENKLSEGICVSNVEDRLKEAGVSNKGVLKTAEVIQDVAALAGNDVCAFAHGLTIDEQQDGASVQLILQIDLLDEKKIDFDKWGIEGVITEQNFVQTRMQVFGMERPYSQTINVGQEIYRLISKKLNKEETATGRRMLADNLNYVDAEGNFNMGAYNPDREGPSSANTTSVSMFVSFLVAFCAIMNFM